MNAKKKHKVEIKAVVDRDGKNLKKLIIPLSQKVCSLFEKNMKNENMITGITLIDNNSIKFTWSKNISESSDLESYIR